MKFVVSGYIGFDNFGDEAVAKALVDKLKTDGAEKITLISSNPEKTAKIHGVESCGMLKFFKPLMEADSLISGGGSLLQDVTSLKSLLYYLTVIYSALFLGKKVEIFAQGIGPINSKIGQILTKNALKKCYKISVRDKKSQELLESWGIKSTLVNDPVLDMQMEKRNNVGTVGIQLRSGVHGLNNDFLKKLSEEVFKRFANKQIKVISLQDSIDFNICKEFADMLTKMGLNVQIVSNLDINEVIECISNLEYLVAMRFHANVVGIKTGVKTIAINYDPKVEKLAKEYNLPMIDFKQSSISGEFNKLFE